jgi:indoleamine 2,3-dioxygenase
MRKFELNGELNVNSLILKKKVKKYLQEHYVSEKLGFLTDPEPLASLPDDESFKEFEKVANLVPKLLISGKLRSMVDKLPPFPTNKLKSRLEIQRAMLVLSVIGNTYLNGNSFINESSLELLPSNIAIPWSECSSLLGRKPIISHASCVLDNWNYIDKKEEFSIQNIRLLNNIVGGFFNSSI